MRLENLGEIGHRWHTCHVPASLRSRRSTPDKPTSDNSLCPSPLWNSISRMVASASRPISSRETNRRTRRLCEPRTRYVPSAPMSFHAMREPYVNMDAAKEAVCICTLASMRHRSLPRVRNSLETTSEMLARSLFDARTRVPMKFSFFRFS